MPDTTHQLYALYLDSHVYLSTQTAIFFRTDILLFSQEIYEKSTLTHFRWKHG